MPFDRKKPIGAPSSGKEPYSARLSSGAFSVATNAAPDHSPPSPMPCTKRHRHSTATAATPHWL